MRCGRRAAAADCAMTVGQALAQAGLVPLDGQVLLAHVVGQNRAWLVAHRDDPLPRAQADAFFALAKRRRDGEPVAHLTGVREFWGLALAVTPDVLIPRPETESAGRACAGEDRAGSSGARPRPRHRVGCDRARARARAAARAGAWRWIVRPPRSTSRAATRSVSASPTWSSWRRTGTPRWPASASTSSSATRLTSRPAIRTCARATCASSR